MTGPTRRVTVLAQAVWLSLLWYPFSQLTGLPRLGTAAVFPFVYALFDWTDSRFLRVAGRLAAIGATLVMEVPDPFRSLLFPPDFSALAAALPQIGGDHYLLSLEFVLIFGIAGWTLFRRSDSSASTLWILFGGTLVLAVCYTFWHIPVIIPLAGFFLLGLWQIKNWRFARLPGRLAAPPRFGWRLTVSSLLLVPMAAGALIPVKPGHWTAARWNALQSSLTGQHVTGLGIGVPNINHSVIPDPSPVLTITGAPRTALWKSAQYTRFNGTSWSNPPQTAVAFSPGQRLDRLFPNVPSNLSVERWRVTVHNHTPNSRVVYTGTPMRLQTGQGGQGQYLPESASIQVTPKVSSYRLLLAVPNFPAKALSALPWTEANTPAGLRPDLEVPSNLSPKVHQMAVTIAKGATGPWQAVQALSAYLKSHEHYTLNFIPSPTGNAVNQFLLVTHAGYCDQFSTSLVMMARTLNIPARWVVGYNAGQYDPSTRTDTILGSDAHSWAEVWMGPYGWVPVDPTPAVTGGGTTALPATQPGTPSPTAQPAPAPQKPPAAPPGGGAGPSVPRIPLALGLSGLAAALLAFGILQVKRNRMGARIERMERGFRRLAGRRPDPARTWRDLFYLLPLRDRAAAAIIVETLEQWAFEPDGPTPDQVAQAERCLKQIRRVRRNGFKKTAQNPG